MTQVPTPILLLASGRGGNVKALLEHQSRRQRLGEPCVYEVKAVVTDKSKAKVREVAKEFGVKCEVLEPSREGDRLQAREAQESTLIEFARSEGAQWLVLCGYMRLLSPKVIRAFWNPEKNISQIVNIHPSLLPKFPGLHGYQQAFEKGEKATGVTIHLVDEQMDHGPVCAQEAFNIKDCGTVEEVETRGLALEHRLYDQTLMWLLKNTFKVKNESGRTHVCPS